MEGFNHLTSERRRDDGSRVVKNDTICCIQMVFELTVLTELFRDVTFLLRKSSFNELQKLDHVGVTACSCFDPVPCTCFEGV